MQDIHEAPSVKTMEKLLTTERNNDLIFKKIWTPTIYQFKRMQARGIVALVW